MIKFISNGVHYLYTRRWLRVCMFFSKKPQMLRIRTNSSRATRHFKLDWKYHLRMWFQGSDHTVKCEIETLKSFFFEQIFVVKKSLDEKHQSVRICHLDVKIIRNYLEIIWTWKLFGRGLSKYIFFWWTSIFFEIPALKNIYDKNVLWKLLMTFSRYLFSQKLPK